MRKGASIVPTSKPTRMTVRESSHLARSCPLRTASSSSSQSRPHSWAVWSRRRGGMKWTASRWGRGSCPVTSSPPAGCRTSTGKLPGEEVAFVTGDLEIDGTRVLKSPRQLAELGSTVELGRRDSAEAGLTADWSRPVTLVLDDALFATAEVSRRLLPVQDVGAAAVVHVPAGSHAGRPCRVRAEAGPLAVTWRLAAPGRYGVAAGRLDGHAVAAAWPLPDGAEEHERSRSCLPTGAPDRWDVVRPWPATDAAAALEPPAHRRSSTGRACGATSSTAPRPMASPGGGSVAKTSSCSATFLPAVATRGTSGRFRGRTSDTGSRAGEVTGPCCVRNGACMAGAGRNGGVHTAGVPVACAFGLA